MSNTMKTTRHLMVAASALLAMGTADAWAQASAQGDQLEEVVVTARRVQERLQDVPVTVTAFTAADIQKLGATDITQLSLKTPGFSMQNASRQNEQPFIRGFSVNSAFRDQQAASFFIDGLYVAGVGRAINLEDVDRVEVVLGPQATQFGRATFAGAINYVSKKPTDEWEGKASFRVGEHNAEEATAGISGPIVQGLLDFRLFLQRQTYGGEYGNVLRRDLYPTAPATLPSYTFGQQDSQGYSAALRFTPTDALEVLARVQDTRFNDNHQAAFVTPAAIDNCARNAAGLFTAYCGLLPTPPSGLNTDKLLDGGFRDISEQRYNIQVNYDLNDFRFQYNVAYNRGHENIDLDGDGLPVNAASSALTNTYYRTQFSDWFNELRVNSPTDQPLRGMLGVSYFFARRNDSNQFLPTISNSATQRQMNIGAYGQIVYDILSNLTATAEIRIQRERVNVAGRPFSTSFPAALPRFSLQYKPIEDVMTYASFSKGDKPGRFNTAALVPPAYVAIREEILNNYELGVKSEFFEKRLRVDADVYHADWKNQVYQDTLLAVNPDGTPAFQPGSTTIRRTVVVGLNSGKSEVNGAELSIDAVPLPGLDINLGYALTLAQYRKFVSSTQSAIASAAGSSVSGHYLQNSPLHKYSAVATYTHDLDDVAPWLGGWSGYVSGDITVRGKQYLDETNLPYIPTLTLANARIGLQDGHYNAYLWVTNLTDTRVPDYATRFGDYSDPSIRAGYQYVLRPSRAFGAYFSYTY